MSARHMSPMGAAALQYASLGLPIFPLAPRSKQPKKGFAGGFRRATTDAAQIEEWWEQYPDANIGLALGPASMFVIDVDPRNGGTESLAAIENRHGPLPDTWTAGTPQGGNHYYFRLPGGVRLRKELAPGIDLKGESGYVLVEPSVTEHGAYHFLDWEPPDPPTVAEAPAWLIEMASVLSDSASTDGFTSPGMNAQEKADVRSALDIIPADDREDWLTVGAALHETGDHEAFSIWCEWSRKSSKFDSQEQIRTWKSFGCYPGRRATIRSIFKMAQAAGWKNPRKGHDTSPGTPWGEPVHFGGSRTPEIPASLLPGVTGQYAEQVARFTETASALGVIVVLGVISTAAAGRFVVSPFEGYREHVNVYGVVGLPPGNRKTSVFESFVHPLIEWERRMRALLEPDIQRSASERKSLERIIEGRRAKLMKIQDDIERRAAISEIARLERDLPMLPALPRLFVNDATLESLATAVADQGGRMAVLSDEGGLLDVAAGLYSNGRANVDLLLKGIDGGSVRILRKDREVDLNPLLTLVLAVQPRVIEALAEKRALVGRGFVDRILYALPKSTLGSRTHRMPPPDGAVQVRYNEIIEKLLALQPIFVDGKEQPRVLRLAMPALQAWRTFQEEIEHGLGEGGRFAGAQGWAGKLPGVTLRLAALMHLAALAEREFTLDGQAMVIHEPTMAPAIELARLLIDHALAAFDLIALTEEAGDARAAWAWISSNASTGSFTRAALTVGLRHRGIDSRRLTRALDVLAERCLIDSGTRTGHKTIIFRVNPAAL